VLSAHHVAQGRRLARQARTIPDTAALFRRSRLWPAAITHLIRWACRKDRATRYFFGFLDYSFAVNDDGNNPLPTLPSETRLDYAPRIDAQERKRISTASYCFWFCLFATPFTWAAAIMDPGWHGRTMVDPHLFAKLLFPYTMLSTLTPPWVVSGPFLLMGVVQYPLYGAILAMFALSAKQRWAAVALGSAHVTAVACCFLLHVR
jgi:hypothetical protein